jgi:predicted DNA-binding ribbon-helix-helix protein
MRSSITKRSVTIRGHKTSITLEDIFWQSLREIAVARNVGLSTLLDEIDGGRQRNNLSSHIRMFVLEYFRRQAGADGDVRARGRTRTPSSADPN